MSIGQQAAKWASGRLVCLGLFLYFHYYTFLHPSVLYYDSYRIEEFYPRMFGYLLFMAACAVQAIQRSVAPGKEDTERPSGPMPPPERMKLQIVILVIAVLVYFFSVSLAPTVQIMWIAAEIQLILNLVRSFSPAGQQKEYTSKGVGQRIYSAAFSVFQHPAWLPCLTVVYLIYLWFRPEGVGANPFFPLNPDRVLITGFTVAVFLIAQLKESVLYQKHILYAAGLWIQVAIFLFIYQIVSEYGLNFSPVILCTFIFLLYGMFIEVFITTKELL